MPLIQPAGVPRVALAFMNDDHDAETVLVNELDDLLEACDGHDTQHETAIDAKLLEIADHTREHFGREEEVMRRITFPAYLVHKSEHDRVLALIDQVAATWQGDRDLDRLKAFIRKDLPTWFVEHIQSMDTVTAMFAADRGET